LGVHANTVNQATVNLLRLQCNISRLATWSRVLRAGLDDHRLWPHPLCPPRY